MQIWWSYDLIINYCVCVVDADILLLLLFLPFSFLPSSLPSFIFSFFFFLSSAYSTFSPKFALATSSWIQARSIWNFNAICRLVSLRAGAFLCGNPIYDLETHRAVSSQFVSNYVRARCCMLKAILSVRLSHSWSTHKRFTPYDSLTERCLSFLNVKFRSPRLIC